MRRVVLPLGFALAATCVSPLAEANGRFPRAQQLVPRPGTPGELVLRATYGIVSTPNRGEDWFITCEGAVGYGDTEDPAIGVTEDGTLLVGIFKGLQLTRDGCDYESVPEPLNRFVADVTVEKGDPKNALVIISAGGGPGGTFINQIHFSSDNARSFSQLGPNLDGNLILFTLDPAPSDPQIIYVSARDTTRGVGVVLRSGDRAQTWQTFDVPGTDSSHNPFIGAVHPTNPNQVWVRIDGEREIPFPDGGPRPPKTRQAEDTLLVSNDGGQTWQNVLARDSKLLGFALSPDGSTVLAGFGDPRDPEVAVDDQNPAALGVYRVSTTDLSSEQILPDPVSCLTWAPDAIYVCGSQFVQGFELGEMPDANFTLADPSPLTNVLEFADLDKLMQCSPDSSVCAGRDVDGNGTIDANSACPSAFADTCELLQTCPDGGAAGGSGVISTCGPAPGTGGGAGTGGATGTGGAAAGSGGSAGSGDDGGGGGGGCSCRLPAQPAPGRSGFVTLLVGGLAVWRRRRP